MLRKRRFLSMLLSLVLILGTIPITAIAEQTESERTGLCEHHPQHTDECGYTEGTPCTYVCEICNPRESGETEDAGTEGEPATPGGAIDSTVSDVQALIDALPTAEELESMTQDEQAEVYEQVQATYDAYNALTDEQKEQITGAETFDALFGMFNGMTNVLATTNNVSYLDENGNQQTAESATVVESSTTSWNAGWYVVNSNVTISSRITVSGEVNLILADGYTLTASQGITVDGSNSLTIYGQTSGTGTLKATTNNAAAGIGGLYAAGGTITINGGTVEATGGGGAAGIGGGLGGAGGTITINGGTVTATGGDNPGGSGIGGGQSGAGGTITINGGTVTATGGSGGNGGAGIGGGSAGAGGSGTITGGTVTATGRGTYGRGIGSGSSSQSNGNCSISGNAVVFASSDSSAPIGNTSGSDNWNGIVFQGNSGQVYGDVTLEDNLEIPSGSTLTVPDVSTLTIPEGVTVIGGITNNGTVNNSGTVTGGITGGTVNVPSTVSVTVTPSPATYGSTVSITANISQASSNALTRAAANQVEFFVGTGNSKKSLGTAAVSNNTATLSNVTITTDSGWALGNNTITAEYGGGTGLLGNSNTTTLTVNAIPLDAPTGLAWSTTTPGQATWSAVTNASGYSVQLYKDGSAQGSPITASGTTYGFANTITQAGSYTFTVTATGSGAYSDSSPSSRSAALYTVSFDTNGGTGTIPVQLVTNGGYATEPTTDPTYTGHRFDGWYSDSTFAEGSEWTFATSTVTAATTLYAKWTASTYKVTLETNGGTMNNGNVTEYTYGEGATLPTNVTREGYAFAGWYEDRTFTGNAVTAIGATETGDKTYYAKWLSSDAGITSVSVSGTTGTVNGSQISVVLPATTASLPTDSTEVSITPADLNAKVSILATTDNGSTWTFTVTAEDGTTTASYTINVAIQISGTVAINGTPVCGQALTATYEGNADNVTYQWYRDDEEISDTTGATYTLTVEDVGHQLYVIATAVDSIYTDYIMSSTTIAIGPSYTVTIPEKVDLGGTVTISASDVNVASGQQLEVEITGTSGDNDAFTLTSQEGAVIPYTVTAGNDPVSLNSTVLTVNGGEANAKGETSLTFVKPDEEEISFAGTYTGTMTFTIRTREVSGS